ncbi:MAG: VUT family protein [Gammaproteobacteria bacterium]|nr:VUT family protein [Gammaproteobacteria bacterium]
MNPQNNFTFSRAQILLTTLFLATNFTYFTMAPRILHIFNLYEPGGILIFPFTFLLSDIITEVYSYKYSRFLIWCVILTLGIFSFFAWVSMLIPTAVLNYGYNHIFSNYPRLFFSIAVATFFSFFINNYIIAKLKIKMRGKYFWLRSLMSTSVGHATFSATWVIIFHWHEVGSLVILKLIGCMYLWKMTFEIVATPLATFISHWLKKREGFDLYDINTNFNPFKLVQ